MTNVNVLNLNSFTVHVHSIHYHTCPNIPGYYYGVELPYLCVSPCPSQLLSSECAYLDTSTPKPTLSVLA